MGGFAESAHGAQHGVEEPEEEEAQIVRQPEFAIGIGEGLSDLEALTDSIEPLPEIGDQAPIAKIFGGNRDFAAFFRHTSSRRVRRAKVQTYLPLFLRKLLYVSLSSFRAEHYWWDACVAGPSRGRALTIEGCAAGKVAL